MLRIQILKLLLSAIATAAAGRPGYRRIGVGRMLNITNFAVEANDAKSLLALGIQSPTLTKQIQKRVALKYLCDVRQVIKNKIA